MGKRATIALSGALVGAVLLRCAPQERAVAPDRPAAREAVDGGAPDVAPPKDTRVGSTKLSCLRPGLEDELHRCTTLPNPPIAYGEVWSRFDTLTRTKRPPRGGGSSPRPLTREETAFFDVAREYLCAEQNPPVNTLDLSFERGRS
ncbi:MAG TPA: hypothetical protein VF316_04955, partial [Polyangiaceae bacterium]